MNDNMVLFKNKVYDIVSFHNGLTNEKRIKGDWGPYRYNVRIYIV